MPGRKVAFLSTELGPHFVTDDDLAVPPLRERGVQVDFVGWREPADWAAYDLVVVRSTWDYQNHLDRFLDRLAGIDRATRLENPLPLQRWNVRKTYLRDLAAAGVPVVPTLWRDRLEAGGLAELFEEAGARELVLKPVVGASGEDTFRIDVARIRDREPELLPLFRDRALMAQPFLSRVLEDGEVSVVWIDGAVSHALRKVPRPGEFRSQEEHGGRVARVELDDVLRAAAGRVAAAVAGLAPAALSPAPPLYGRVDFLPGADGWLVGELELVEPSLYLRVDAGAPDRLARAIAGRLGVAG